MTDIYSVCKARREELKISLEDISRECNVNIRTIGRFENGQTNLNYTTFLRYIHALKMQVHEDFFTHRQCLIWTDSKGYQKFLL